MLKESEKNIINELRKNSRKNIKCISKDTKIPITSTFNKIRRIEKIIKKYTSLIDFKHVSFPIRIIFVIKLKKDKKEEMETLIEDSLNINNVYRTSAGYSYIIDCYFQNLEQVYLFEKQIQKLSARAFIKHEIIKELVSEQFTLQ